MCVQNKLIHFLLMDTCGNFLPVTAKNIPAHTSWTISMYVSLEYMLRNGTHGIFNLINFIASIVIDVNLLPPYKITLSILKFLSFLPHVHSIIPTVKNGTVLCCLLNQFFLPRLPSYSHIPTDMEAYVLPPHAHYSVLHSCLPQS